MGLDLDWELSFSVTVNESVFLFTRFVLVTGFIDQEAIEQEIIDHSQMYYSFSVREDTVTGSVFVFFKGVCLWFVIFEDINVFRAKITSVSLSSGNTPRAIQDPMLNTLEKAIARELDI